jgi:hypothetical protein
MNKLQSADFSAAVLTDCALESMQGGGLLEEVALYAGDFYNDVVVKGFEAFGISLSYAPDHGVGRLPPVGTPLFR